MITLHPGVKQLEYYTNIYREAGNIRIVGPGNISGGQMLETLGRPKQETLDRPKAGNTRKAKAGNIRQAGNTWVGKMLEIYGMAKVIDNKKGGGGLRPPPPF